MMSKEYPKVSIVTPSYNQGEYIEETIKSVVSQGYPNLEYIIIDGGSNDNSVEIIKEYAEKYPYIQWVSEKDRGQSHAINKGFKRSTGEIVAWLNSDDVYEMNAIIDQVELLQNNPDVMLVYGDAIIEDEVTGIKEKFKSAEPFDYYRLIHVNHMIMQPTTFWRRELFDKIGYLDETLNFTMDWEFWIRTGKEHKILYNPITIARAKDYKTTKTFSGGFKRLKEIKMIQDKYGWEKNPKLYRSYYFDTLHKYVYKYSPWTANTIKNILIRIRDFIFGKKKS
jgi:glycosyltransferase involved in cell wall biosynthesis